MPWIVPSHQAPALGLKTWRPRWFSGLGLVLGSLAPDLEFIVPVRRQMFVSHTLLGQAIFTVPVALLLYVLTVGLVIPWLLPYLPQPWRDLGAIERGRGANWWAVALSAFAGGLTHIFLDGFTHSVPEGGWAVPFLPWLRTPVPLPFGAVALHDVLQIVLTVLLGVTTLLLWRRILRRRLLWAWRDLPAPPASLGRPRSARGLIRWLALCVCLGIGGALLLRPAVTAAEAVELASYGLLDGLAVGLLAGALARRVTLGAQRALPAGSVSAS